MGVPYCPCPTRRQALLPLRATHATPRAAVERGSNACPRRRAALLHASHRQACIMAELLQTSILRISDEQTMRLIDLYKNEECLWNTKIDDYKNKYKRLRAADRIAKALAIPNFSARHVQMKFKNLRNSYSQELKKIQNSKALGEPEYRPRVYWFPKLHSFIRPHLQQPHLRQIRTAQPAEDTYTYSDDGQQQLVSGDEEFEEHSGTENESCDTRPLKRKRESKNRCAKAKRLRPRHDEIDSESSIASSLKDISANLQLLVKGNDDFFENFGKYVAGLLRSLPLQAAMELQPKIVSLLTSPRVPNTLEIRVPNEYQDNNEEHHTNTSPEYGPHCVVIKQESGNLK